MTLKVWKKLPSFDRVRIPEADGVTDWDAVAEDIAEEVGHINQMCAALIASGSLAFVVAPILRDAHVLSRWSYLVIAVLAGAGIYLALTAAATRTGHRTLGTSSEGEGQDSLGRFARKERYAFYSTWLVGLSLAAIFLAVLVRKF